MEQKYIKYSLLNEVEGGYTDFTISGFSILSVCGQNHPRSVIYTIQY